MSQAGELMSKLTGGRVALVDSYEQKKRIKAFAPSDQKLARGLCEGQCLHWLRRVLQGGKDAYKPSSVNKDGTVRTNAELLGKAGQQFAGGVAAQRLLDPAVRTKIVTQTATQLAARLTELVGQGKLTVPEANALMVKYNDKDFYQTDWNKMAAMLDAQLRNTKVKRKRGFSGIVCVSAKTRGPMSIKGFSSSLESQGLYKNGRGGLLTGGVNGFAHAVGTHVGTTGETFLFDPNYGTFKCSNAAALGEAIVTLMTRIWPEVEKWPLDNEYGYAIFEAKVSQIEVAPGEHEVSFRHGEHGTYLANQATLRLR